MTSVISRKHVRPGERGQELVEFALLLPLLLLIAFGVLDLGRAFHASITIANAAREGARYGTFHPGDFAGIIATTQAEAQNSGIIIAAEDIAVSCPAGCDRGFPIRVLIQYPFDLVMGLVFPDPTLTLEQGAEMMIP
jgi:hypothetical protein